MKTQALGLALLLGAVDRAVAQGTLYTFDGLDEAIAGIGDLDGDGVRDVLASRAGASGALGVVEARSGRDGGLIRAVTGIAIDDTFGSELAVIGDVDQDGIEDFAVGAPNVFSSPLPYARAFSGKTGAVLWTVQHPSSALLFGHALSGGGDVDGDGFGDLVIGAPPQTFGAIGEAWVVSGVSGALIRAHVASPAGALRFGRAVCLVGDVDGDSRADYAVGEGVVGGLGGGQPGRVTTFSGAHGGVLHAFVGAGSFDELGASLASLGDVDNDGRPDLVVGAPGEVVQAFSTGSAQVHSGASGALIHDVPAGGGELQVGRSVAALGDQDGDGRDDFAFHQPLLSVGGVVKNFGRVFVRSGATGQALTSWTAQEFGPIASVGDLNGDGFEDFGIAGGGSGGSSFYSRVLLSHAPEPAGYCTAKTSSNGCTPTLQAAGAFSLSVGPDGSVTSLPMPSGRIGAIVWSLASSSTPFAGGTLCVAPPHVFKVVGSTGGGGGGLDCSGSLATTFPKAYLGAQGIGAGTEIFLQAWCRDPGFAPPNAASLSNGLRATIWP